MHRRRRRGALRWMAWIGAGLALLLVSFALIQIDDVVRGQGIVDPGQKTYIDSPLKRVVEKVFCYPGTHIAANQPVAQLYDGDLRTGVASADKEVQRAQANLEAARAFLSLLEERPTPEELRIAESKVEQAEINLTARKQDLERAKHLYLGERLWSREDIERARTNHELAQAGLKLAVGTYNLVRRGASPAELRQAEAEVRQTEAALDKSRHSLDAAREELELATLRSPVDGVVARLDLHPGMLAEQGQIVMIIAGNARGPVIDAWVSETSAWKIRLGNRVEILSNLFTDPEAFMAFGEISKFYGYAVHEGGSRSFELEVGIKDTPLPLKYGSTADLYIIVGRRSILKILLGIENRSAIQDSQSHDYLARPGSGSKGSPRGQGTAEVASPSPSDSGKTTVDSAATSSSIGALNARP